MIEREKRWKINGEIPAENIIDKFIITQTYSNFKPDVRIRKVTRDNIEEFSHCVKYQLQNNEREEVEQKISKERYNRIFEVINKKPVIKERTIVDIGDGLLAEVDKFEEISDVIVEVEFPTVESMKDFTPPSWFGNEVKNNKSTNYTVFTKINKLNFSVWD